MRALLVALNARYIHTSPAVRMLSSACRARGLDAPYLECDISRPLDAVLRDIVLANPDAVGFTCHIWSVGAVRALTRSLRRAMPDVFIVWGGPEVSFDASERLADCPELDAVVRGEGEIVFPDLLDRLSCGLAPDGVGVCTRASDGGFAPPVPPEKWPELYPSGDAAEASRLWYAETSRGCPFSCAYCVSAAFPGVRALGAEEAVARLLAARDAGAKTVKLLDRTFNFDAQRARAVWAALIDRGAGAVYHFEIAAHLLGREDIALLSRAPAGLFQFEIGIQTTNDRSLQKIGRAQDFARVKETVRALAAADNIHLHVDLIAGLPEDTPETFARSLDDALSLGAHHVQLGFLKLLPGTPLRARAAELRIAYSPDPPYRVISTPGMTFADLCALMDIEAVLEIYVNSGAYPTTSARCLGSHAELAQLAKNLRASGFFDAPRSRSAKADALYNALGGGDALERMMRHDWLSSGERAYRPFMRGDPARGELAQLKGRDRRAHAERFGDQVVTYGLVQTFTRHEPQEPEAP